MIPSTNDKANFFTDPDFTIIKENVKNSQNCFLLKFESQNDNNYNLTSAGFFFCFVFFFFKISVIKIKC